MALGLDVVTGDTMSPEAEGVWDNAGVKRQSIHLSTVLATKDAVSLAAAFAARRACPKSTRSARQR